MSSPILVTCPFCGNDKLTSSDHRLYGIYCPKCGSLGHLGQACWGGKLCFIPDTKPVTGADALEYIRENPNLFSGNGWPRMIRDDDPPHNED